MYVIWLGRRTYLTNDLLALDPSLPNSCDIDSWHHRSRTALTWSDDGSTRDHAQVSLWGSWRVRARGNSSKVTGWPCRRRHGPVLPIISKIGRYSIEAGKEFLSCVWSHVLSVIVDLHPELLFLALVEILFSLSKFLLQFHDTSFQLLDIDELSTGRIFDLGFTLANKLLFVFCYV